MNPCESRLELQIIAVYNCCNHSSYMNILYLINLTAGNRSYGIDIFRFLMMISKSESSCNYSCEYKVTAPIIISPKSFGSEKQAFWISITVMNIKSFRLFTKHSTFLLIKTSITPLNKVNIPSNKFCRWNISFSFPIIFFSTV